MTIQLLEVRKGRIKTYGEGAGAWSSAIGKEPAAGPVQLDPLGLDGDQVGCPEVHGGLDQAVLAYASEHYPRWREEGFAADPGAFGENLLLSGLTDQQACIGDIYALGEVLLQVSHPRQPCDTLARRFGRKDVVAQVWTHARGGWYCRVLRPGPVAAGMDLILKERPNPGATVARVLTAYLDAAKAPAEALAMAALPGLTREWQVKLEKKAGGQTS